MHCEYLEMISDEFGMYDYYCELQHRVVDANECILCDCEVPENGLQPPIRKME